MRVNPQGILFVQLKVDDTVQGRICHHDQVLSVNIKESCLVHKAELIFNFFGEFLHLHEIGILFVHFID
jgi:hypothetical protein